MAMNKKEQAELARLQDELTRSYALGWSKLPVPERSIKPPTDGSYVEGWDGNPTFTSYSGAPSPEIYWTGSVSHGLGRAPVRNKYSSGSQNGRSLFATRLDALIYQRLELEKRFAKLLGDVDKSITTERLNPTPINPNP